MGAPAFAHAQREPARFHQADRSRPGDGSDRTLEGLLRLSPAAAERSELPEAFENENFDFWQRYLDRRQGTAAALGALRGHGGSALGDLLGQKYIELAFGADAKAQITQLVDALEKAMAQDIRTLPWMTEETKKAALAKLKAITNNVGYPKKWRDYSKVTIARDDFFGNALRTGAVGLTSGSRRSASPPTRPNGA